MVLRERFHAVTAEPRGDGVEVSGSTPCVHSVVAQTQVSLDLNALASGLHEIPNQLTSLLQEGRSGNLRVSQQQHLSDALL